MSNEVKKQESVPLWKRLLFSELIVSKTMATRIAYIGLMTALCIIANTFLEIKFFDFQYSFTICISVLTGIFIGPLFGFCAAFLGDLIGYFYGGGAYIYMPWVGLSVSCMALIAGLVMNVRLRFKGSLFVKLAVICILTFFICSVGINTTSLYFYYKSTGFSTAFLQFVESKVGANASFLMYCLYRYFINGQIYNSIANYVLLFIIVPALAAIKPLKLNFS